MDILALAPLFVSFRHMVAHDGLRPASRATGISTSTLSRHLGALEEALGVRLADRNTRAFALTPAGAQLLRSLGDVEGLLRRSIDAMGPAEDLVGRVRLSAPTVLTAGALMPVIEAFQAAHPRAILQVVDDDRLHALIDEVDLVIRNGPLTDPDLTARRLFRAREVLIAAPEVARAPVDAEALAALPWVVLTRTLPPEGYRLTSDSGEVAQFVPVRRIESNGSEHVLAMIEAGLGVGVMLEGLNMRGAQPLGWRGPSIDFMLAHAGGTRPSRLVRALADLVVARFELGAARR